MFQGLAAASLRLGFRVFDDLTGVGPSRAVTYQQHALFNESVSAQHETVKYKGREPCPT